MLTLDVYQRYRKMCALCGRKLVRGNIHRFPLCAHSACPYCVSRKRILRSDQGHLTLDCPEDGLFVCKVPKRNLLRMALLGIGRRHLLAEYRRQQNLRRNIRRIKLARVSEDRWKIVKSERKKSDWSSLHVPAGLSSYEDASWREKLF